MMVEILIPANELERLSRLLAAVHDTVGGIGDLDQFLDGQPAVAIGDVRLAGAIDDFHSRCQHGHRRLRAEMAWLSVQAAEIVRAVHDADHQLGELVTELDSRQ